MCGIAGKACAPGERPPSRALLEAMADSMYHRGPDDEGYHLEDEVGLAHRRLSIVDLSGGRQPLSNEDGTVIAVVNGEIYNHLTLRRILGARGHQFRTQSDCEAVLHAYEEWGEDFAHHLRGMFGVAIWDRTRKSLVLARDRLGIKPLYYALVSQPDSGLTSLVFGSEIKAILIDPSVDRSMDWDALGAYLALRYVPGPATLLQWVKKLQPGHILTFRGGIARIRAYWDLPLDHNLEASRDNPLHESLGADAADSHLNADHEHGDPAMALRSLLDRCVQSHLMADVPVGVFLSGGVDSSAVAAIMAQAAARNPETQGPVLSFSIGYPGAPLEDELAHARLAADFLGTRHQEVILDAREARDLLPAIAWHMDEPVADPAAIPLYVLARQAAREVKVVLSGEGADELFAGYTLTRRVLATQNLRESVGPLLGWAAMLGRSLPVPHYIYRHLERLGEPLETSYRGVSGAFTDRDRRLLQGWETTPLDPFLGPTHARAAHLPLLSRILYLDTKVWLPDDLLIKADKMTMAHGLELRVPFLDHVFVERASRMPAHHKVQGNLGKVLLKQAVRGLIPSSLITRTKQGFPIPISTWLKDPALLGGYAQDRLLCAGSLCRDFFPADPLKRLLSLHQSGREDRSQELWTLLFLDAWYETVVRPGSHQAHKDVR